MTTREGSSRLCSHAAKRVGRGRLERSTITSATRLVVLLLVLGAAPVLPAAAAAAAVGPVERLPIPNVPATATRTLREDDGRLRVSATLLHLPSQGAPAPDRVGVLFELGEGWHVYWRNPGDTGIAPKIRWKVDEHDVGALSWPAPERFREADGLFTTFGYEGQVLLAAPLTARREATGREILTVHVSALVCRTECMPAEFSLARPLAFGGDAKSRKRTRALFARHDARLPESPDALPVEIAVHRSLDLEPGDEAIAAGVIEIRSCVGGEADCVPYVPAPESAIFIPDLGEDVHVELGETVALGDDGRAFSIPYRLEAVDGDKPPAELRGILALQRPDEAPRRVMVSARVTRATTGFAGLIQALLLAFVGGIILNGMPCVLPVLAIKVFAVAEMAERSRRELLAHGIAYTVGVIGSMVALAGVVIGLRAAGLAVGWGFQFQEPLFVVAISALLVAFALNLFGVYEIDLGAGRLADLGSQATGTRRSFFEGLLAVLLATPCSAPFLGPAVGFAFASTPAAIVAIFTSIGLGLAGPFLLISAVPAMRRFVPRAGPWMHKLRSALGFSLLATCVWLVSIVGHSGGVDGTVSLLGFLLFLAFGLWILGSVQASRRTGAGLGVVLALVFAVGTGLNFVRAEIDASSSEIAGIRTDSALGRGKNAWQVYDADRVREVVSAGRPAFVVFTADWCITCKVNERLVLRRNEVEAALERGGFARFEADWTHRDDEIREQLAAYGRAGVPLYLVFEANRPDSPRVLSELLTVNRVLSSLHAAAARARGA